MYNMSEQLASIWILSILESGFCLPLNKVATSWTQLLIGLPQLPCELSELRLRTRARILSHYLLSSSVSLAQIIKLDALLEKSLVVLYKTMQHFLQIPSERQPLRVGGKRQMNRPWNWKKKIRDPMQRDAESAASHLR